jgi:hypothetical protein
MATELAEKILALALPGLELVEPDPTPAGVDQLPTTNKPSPSLAELRAKYLGYAADASPAQSPTAITEYIEVQQARSRAGNPNPIGKRTLIFSEKGLIGSQG